MLGTETHAEKRKYNKKVIATPRNFGKRNQSRIPSFRDVFQHRLHVNEPTRLIFEPQLLPYRVNAPHFVLVSQYRNFLLAKSQLGFDRHMQSKSTTSRLTDARHNMDFPALVKRSRDRVPTGRGNSLETINPAPSLELLKIYRLHPITRGLSFPKPKNLYRKNTIRRPRCSRVNRSTDEPHNICVSE